MGLVERLYIIMGERNNQTKLTELHELQNRANHSFSRKKLFESHYDTFKEEYKRLLRGLIMVQYIVLAGKDISIFGFSFGDDPGVVFVDNQKSEIAYWSDNRMDIIYSGTVSEESTLTVITNVGLLMTEQLRNLQMLRPQPMGSSQ
jgi:hypothetical protein